jgi:glutamate--cysteine ligase
MNIFDGQSTPADSVKPLSDFQWGLERETHRVQRDGSLSLSPHPEALRAPRFTRDFAESQLEMVTPPAAGISEVLSDLERLTETAERSIGEELLWPFSMPPRLPEESEIPIARFGTGEAARRAELYRRGLALRYGKTRQMICGVHLNVSFGASLVSNLTRMAPLTREEAMSARLSDAYALRLARGLYRELPLLILLTGASPVRGGGVLREDRYAVSYRNSKVGYAGREFWPFLDLESLEAYVSGIRNGLKTESEAFSSLGLIRGGSVIQLNGRVFQSEKEFYAPIRLRQALLPGESTVQALSLRGVGYLELRFLDVDPFSRIGVAEETLRLLHLFILDGLAKPSTPMGRNELQKVLTKAADTALLDPVALIAGAGRRPDPVLKAAVIRLSELSDWAIRLDRESGDDSYSRSLDLFTRRIADPRLLSSATLIGELEESGHDWTSLGARRVSEARTQGVVHALEYAGV